MLDQPPETPRFCPHALEVERWTLEVSVPLTVSRLPGIVLALCRRGHHSAAVRTDEEPCRRGPPRLGAGLHRYPAPARERTPGDPGNRSFAAWDRLRRDPRGEAASADPCAGHDCLSGRLGT